MNTIENIRAIAVIKWTKKVQYSNAQKLADYFNVNLGYLCVEILVMTWLGSIRKTRKFLK